VPINKGLSLWKTPFYLWKNWGLVGEKKRGYGEKDFNLRIHVENVLRYPHFFHMLE